MAKTTKKTSTIPNRKTAIKKPSKAIDSSIKTSKPQVDLSEKDIKLLNSKKGIMSLLLNKDVNLNRSLRYIKYAKNLEKLQEELIKLQQWVVREKKKVCVIFEGRDAAGKGGAIRRITEHLNPREYRVVALGKPDESERYQWYFQRYVNQLPKAGEIVFFDRSWYNRAIVEPVNGFCTPDEYQKFIKHVNSFEQMLIDSDIILIKFYFSISKEEQKRRFQDILNSPEKIWKFSEVDKKAQDLWDVYTEYKEKMLAVSDTKTCPWKIIQADRKTSARIEAIKYILKKIPYNA